MKGAMSRLSPPSPLACNRLFQPALFRRLVESEPHEHWSSQLHPTFRTLVSPLGEFDFRHKFRTHKVNFSQSANLAVKRILFRLERLQASKHFFKRLVIETSAHLSNVNQPSLLVMQAEGQRAEILAASLGIGVASDDALLTLRDFDFQPIARTLLFVDASALLGEDAFQSTLLRRFKKIKSFFGVVI